MKKLILPIIVVGVAAASIFLFAVRPGEARAQFGHTRQAFFPHVGSVRFVREASQSVQLFFVSEGNVNEFSDAANIHSVRLIGANGSASIPVEVENLQTAGSMDGFPEGASFVTLTLRIDPATLVASHIAVRFVDGIEEAFPIGSLSLEDLSGRTNWISTDITFDEASGTLKLPEGRFQDGQYPGGRRLKGMAAWVPVLYNGRLINVTDIDLGAPGVSVDWSRWVDLNCPEVTSSGMFLEQLEDLEDPDDSLNLFYAKVNTVFDYRWTASGELFAYPRCNDVGKQPFIPLTMSDANVLSGQDEVYIERAYPVYYDPAVDFTNTFLIISPVVIYAAKDGVQYGLPVRGAPSVVFPGRFDGIENLLAGQNP